MKLTIDRGAYLAFLHRAKARYPREYIEFLWGRILPHEIQVHVFAEIGHRGTPNLVLYSETVEDHHEEAEELKLQYIGSIHTHPAVRSTAPSEHDWCANETDDHIQGVCALWRTTGLKLRSRVAFWPPAKPLKVTWTKKA